MADHIRSFSFICGVVSFVLAGGLHAFAAQPVVFQGGEESLAEGEDVTFPIVTEKTSPANFKARCVLQGGNGPAILQFDADRYVAFSDPQVGQQITLQANEDKSFDLAATIEPGKVDAYVSFAYVGAPQALCLPGMDCAKAAAGARSVKVSCTGT